MKNEIILSRRRGSEQTAKNRTIFRSLILLTSVLIVGAIGISNAQTSEGTYMLGSDLGSGLVATSSSGLLGFNFGLNKGAGYNLGLSPKAGYFIRDNFLIGAVINLGFVKSPENNGEATKTTIYGVQALSRYYLSLRESEADNFLKRGTFFLENNLGVSGVNVSDGPTTNGFSFGFGPGFAYFISQNVAFETALKYNGLTGGGNTSYQHNIGLNLGVQVFLSSRKAENIIENNNN